MQQDISGISTGLTALSRFQSGIYLVYDFSLHECCLLEAFVWSRFALLYNVINISTVNIFIQVTNWNYIFFNVIKTYPHLDHLNWILKTYKILFKIVASWGVGINAAVCGLFLLQQQRRAINTYLQRWGGKLAQSKYTVTTAQDDTRWNYIRHLSSSLKSMLKLF